MKAYPFKVKRILLLLFIIPSLLLQGSSWNEAVNDYIQRFEKAEEAYPQTFMFPAIAERLRQLFPAQGCAKIDISYSTNGTVSPEMTLYISDEGIEIVNHREGWNLSTDEDVIYE